MILSFRLPYSLQPCSFRHTPRDLHPSYRCLPRQPQPMQSTPHSTYTTSQCSPFPASVFLLLRISRDTHLRNTRQPLLAGRTLSLFACTTPRRARSPCCQREVCRYTRQAHSACHYCWTCRAHVFCSILHHRSAPRCIRQVRGSCCQTVL